MRHQLAALENELVLVQGWFKEHRKRKDIAHLLLTNVHIIKYEGENIAYAKAKTLFTLDHLWCREPKPDNLKGRELFTKVFYVGRVKPYTRADNSIDYAVAIEPFEDIDNYVFKQLDPKLEGIRNSCKDRLWKTRAEMHCLISLLQIMEDKSKHHIGGHMSTTDWRKFISNLYAKAADRFARQLKSQEQQNRKDRRKKPKRVSPHRDQPARGFA